MHARKPADQRLPCILVRKKFGLFAWGGGGRQSTPQESNCRVYMRRSIKSPPRPIMCRALSAIKRPFCLGYRPHGRHRRQATERRLLAGLSCLTPRPTCMCGPRHTGAVCCAHGRPIRFHEALEAASGGNRARSPSSIVLRYCCNHPRRNSPLLRHPIPRRLRAQFAGQTGRLHRSRAVAARQRRPDQHPGSGAVRVHHRHHPKTLAANREDSQSTDSDVLSPARLQPASRHRSRIGTPTRPRTRNAPLLLCLLLDKSRNVGGQDMALHQFFHSARVQPHASTLNGRIDAGLRCVIINIPTGLWGVAYFPNVYNFHAFVV